MIMKRENSFKATFPSHIKRILKMDQINGFYIMVAYHYYSCEVL